MEQQTYINGRPQQVIPRPVTSQQWPTVIRHDHVIKPTWGLAWGLMWRFMVLSLLIYLPIAAFLYFVPMG